MARDVIIPLFAICSIGSAVEYCWALGEVVLVPYLTKHQVPTWVVSTIYLSNPVRVAVGHHYIVHMMCIMLHFLHICFVHVSYFFLSDTTICDLQWTQFGLLYCNWYINYYKRYWDFVFNLVLERCRTSIIKEYHLLWLFRLSL